jgi:hypothetical protein
VKTLTQPITGKTFKMGRRKPIARGLRLRLGNYLKQSLPTPPETVNYAPAAAQALSQMYDNDTLGDCVIACMGHIEGVLTGNTGGSPTILTEKQVIALYSAIGGYVPGNPATDNGCDEQTALDYWREPGLFGDTYEGIITAYMSVDGANMLEVRTALWLFENLVFGVALPDSWVNPMPSASGFWWGTGGAPDPNNGHCFAGVGYNPTGVQISTWGMVGNITHGAIKKYTTSGGGELYCVLSQDAIDKATAKAPNGFDFATLSADLARLG